SNAVETQEESFASQTETKAFALDSVLNIPWFPHSPKNSPKDYDKIYSAPYRKQHDATSLRRKELSRERKKRRVIKTMQEHRFGELIKTYGKRIDGEVTLDILGRLGRESGVREYNAMIQVCVNKAEEAADEDESLKQLCTAFRVFERMREEGRVPDRFSYMPLIDYVANKGMVKEFRCLVQQMEKDDVDYWETGYFEMVLWINDGNKDEVAGLCNQVLHCRREKRPDLA
ncbi:hypothetical protein KI387_020493, partial [Taxus chinensis]